eukprot:867775-Prorocentrum_lima.AAC.1
MASNNTTEQYDYDRVQRAETAETVDAEQGQAAMADKKAAASAPSGAGSASGDAAITMGAVNALKVALA